MAFLVQLQLTVGQLAQDVQCRSVSAYDLESEDMDVLLSLSCYRSLPGSCTGRQVLCRQRACLGYLHTRDAWRWAAQNSKHSHMQLHEALD